MAQHWVLRIKLHGGPGHQPVPKFSRYPRRPVCSVPFPQPTMPGSPMAGLRGKGCNLMV